MNQEKSLNTYEIIKRIYSYVRPYKYMLLLAIFLGLIYSLLSALPIPLFKFVLDLVYNQDLSYLDVDVDGIENLKVQFYRVVSYLIYEKDDISKSLLNLGVILIVIFFVKNIFRFLTFWNQTYLHQSIIKKIRDTVFEKLSSLSLDFFSKSRQGNIISIMTNDVETLNHSIVNPASTLIRELLSVAVNLFFLLAISPHLVLISFSASFFTIFILRVARKSLQKYSQRMQEAMADFTSTLQETISGIKVIQAYNSEKRANDKFFADTRKFVKAGVKQRNMTTLVPSISEIFAISSLTLVLVVGGNKVYAGELQASELILFIVLLFSTMSPLNAITNTIAGFQRGYVSAKRVFDLLDRESSVVSGKNPISNFNNDIIIENLDFAYNEEPVLKNINIKIEKGKKIAFVGSSGSGKSTVLDLILRFYDPKAGNIKIDDKEIKDFDLESYRKLFGIVSQDTILFNDTISNNLKYGNIEADDEKINRALNASNAISFVKNLPKGIETLVGERGQMLSGGERQRLAIARALVREPEILIFDEATSALDSENEKIVQEAIDKSLKDRTAIVVAHRLATIINCDIIYVFDNGTVTESGTHKELLEKNGTYSKLYKIQFGIED